jgi:hypothetical protein
MSINTAGVCVSTFGLAVVVTNSVRSLDWMHPVHINIIGFVCIGVGCMFRMVRREGKSAETVSGACGQTSVLAPEVLLKIGADYPEADRAEVASVLEREMKRLATYGSRPGAVPLYVVLLSRGDRRLFDKYIRIVRGDDGDYRDILILGREQFPEVERAKSRPD